jgi:hypothetical protein
MGINRDKDIGRKTLEVIINYNALVAEEGGFEPPRPFRV